MCYNGDTNRRNGRIIVNACKRPAARIGFDRQPFQSEELDAVHHRKVEERSAEA
jgi:hypothetical protein